MVIIATPISLLILRRSQSAEVAASPTGMSSRHTGQTTSPVRLNPLKIAVAPAGSTVTPSPSCGTQRLNPLKSRCPLQAIAGRSATMATSKSQSAEVAVSPAGISYLAKGAVVNNSLNPLKSRCPLQVDKDYHLDTKTIGSQSAEVAVSPAGRRHVVSPEEDFESQSAEVAVSPAGLKALLAFLLIVTVSQSAEVAVSPAGSGG